MAGNCTRANSAGKNTLFLVNRQITYSSFLGFNYIPQDDNAIIPFSSLTVEKYKEIESGGGIFKIHNIIVKFKDGKKSVIALYDAGYQIFTGSMLSAMLDDF